MRAPSLLRTSEFCAHVIQAATAPLPPAVDRAARRSLFNVLGTTVGAAHSPAVDVILATAADLGITGSVPVLGRTDTLDAHWGALIAGTAGHYDDFDDTHLATVIHPGAATLGALMALHDAADGDGTRFLRAFALGCETQLRIGNSISPNHYDRGWHITATCGVFGAAVAAAILVDLDAAGLEAALAAASTMTLGHREAFGSMTKPFHAGKAAANGVAAARLAQSGYEGFADPLGDDGVLTVFADAVDATQLFGSWDSDWELERNAFKPYPCGIVAHPAIDAAVEASARIADPTAITAIDVQCHPLVPELMGILQPRDGLQARFSARHGVVAGLLDGRVGLQQFSDERATAEDAAALRAITVLQPDDGCARDAATVTVRLADGTEMSTHIGHARGSLARPLTDEELMTKVAALTEPILGTGSAAAILAAVDTIDTDGFAAVVAAARPHQGDAL